MKNLDVMLKRWWGHGDIVAYTKQVDQTVYSQMQRKDFPNEDFVLGTKHKAYDKAKIIAWWKRKMRDRIKEKPPAVNRR